MNNFFALLPTDVALEIDLFSGGIGGDYSTVTTYQLPQHIPAFYGQLVVMPDGKILLGSGNQLTQFSVKDEQMCFGWQRQFQSTILGVYVCESSVVHISLCGNEAFMHLNGYSCNHCWDRRKKYNLFCDYTSKYISMDAHELTIKKFKHLSPEHWREYYWKYPMPFHVRACCFLNSDIWVAGGTDEKIDRIIEMSNCK